MKGKYSFLAFSLLLFIFSCENDTLYVEAPKSTDSIFYSDFMPDRIIETIRYFAINFDPESCGDSPVPNDSSATGSIDVDGDSINDFLFTVRQYSIPGGPGGSVHCLNEVFSIVMNGINPADSISAFQTQTQMVDEPVHYDTMVNSVINQAGYWKNSVTVSLSSQGISWFPAYIGFGENYIGIKINNNCGWIHVVPTELRGIIIKDCALNRTDFNSIRAGQKQ